MNKKHLLLVMLTTLLGIVTVTGQEIVDFNFDFGYSDSKVFLIDEDGYSDYGHYVDTTSREHSYRLTTITHNITDNTDSFYNGKLKSKDVYDMILASRTRYIFFPFAGVGAGIGGALLTPGIILMALFPYAETSVFNDSHEAFAAKSDSNFKFFIGSGLTVMGSLITIVALAAGLPLAMYNYNKFKRLKIKNLNTLNGYSGNKKHAKNKIDMKFTFDIRIVNS